MGRYRAIYTENQNGDGYEAEKNKAEKIRLRRKLIAVVSCMLIIGIAVQSRFAVKAVKRMVCEQAETALVDKTEAVADMLDICNFLVWLHTLPCRLPDGRSFLTLLSWN